LSEERGIILSSAVGRKTELGRIGDLGETLPVTHGLDNGVVSVDTGIDAFNPTSIYLTGVTAHVGVMSLTEGHRFAATVAVCASAVLAVTLSVGDTHGSVIHE
jgi:hypothetical protein